MATITFPSTDQSPFTAPNGVVYVWVTPGNFWMASGDNLTDVYLSKTGDDTAAGAITFEGLTTHEAGVQVTGGSASDMSNGLLVAGGPAVEDTYLTLRGGGLSKANFFRHNVRFNAAGATENPSQAVVSSLQGGPNGATDHEFFAVRRNSAADASYETTKGFVVSNTHLKDPVENVAGNTAYAFYTDLNQFNPTDADAYAFYAAGTAPNYFASGVQFDTAAGTSVLNDYEKGTWTPSVTSGDLGTLKAIAGVYEKIGNVVYVRVTINWDSQYSLSAGGYIISSLPFSGGTGKHSGLVIMGSENNTIRDLGVASCKIQDRDIRVRINNSANVTILSLTGTYDASGV